jgi:hypothetical protein
MTKLEALTIYFGGQAHSPLNNTLFSFLLDVVSFKKNYKRNSSF